MGSRFIPFSSAAAALVTGVWLAWLTSGCMTPERALRETDRIGNRLAADYLQRVTGSTNAFSIERPSDRLRVRLMAAQGLPGTLPTNAPADVAALPEPLVLTLEDALAAGARNDVTYQEKKEAVFSAALELDLQQHLFENIFEGLFSAGVERSDDGQGDARTEAKGGGKAGVRRKLADGATLGASLGLDVIKLLTGDSGSALGMLGDATITMPLLRGAGRLVVQEALTQAERNLVYAVYTFESYRQSYAVRVASAYYGMLEAVQQVEALEDNQKRLSDNHRRAEMMFEAGRMSKIDLDQTRQDLLRTGDQLVRAQQSREARLDEFKMTLGLPADARVEVAMEELARLRTAMGADERAGATAVAAVAPALPWSEGEAIELALTNRHDLIVARMRVADAARAVRIAADDLRPDLGLSGTVSHSRRHVSDGGRNSHATDYGLSLEASPPWERTAERNAYRAALLALDAAARAVETAEDTAKEAVRSGLRSLQAAWSSFGIQSEAVGVALLRVHSTVLFQQAGRADMRDVLDAESALLDARNALTSAMVRYRLAGLELRRDLAVLELSAEGLWREMD